MNNTALNQKRAIIANLFLHTLTYPFIIINVNANKIKHMESKIFIFKKFFYITDLFFHSRKFASYKYDLN